MPTEALSITISALKDISHPRNPGEMPRQVSVDHYTLPCALRRGDVLFYEDRPAGRRPGERAREAATSSDTLWIVYATKIPPRTSMV